MASTRLDHGDHTAHLVLGCGVVDYDRLEESTGVGWIVKQIIIIRVKWIDCQFGGHGK